MHGSGVAWGAESGRRENRRVVLGWWRRLAHRPLWNLDSGVELRAAMQRLRPVAAPGRAAAVRCIAVLVSHVATYSYRLAGITLHPGWDMT